MNPYKQIFSKLNKAKIDYIIVGGVAVNLHGYSRFTGDVDILLALDSENLQKMDNLMRKIGYTERLPVKVTSLDDEKQVEKWIKEKGMTAYTFVSEKMPQLDIDILVENSINFQKFFINQVKVEAWGIELPVISINELIKMKKDANRPQDLQDIKMLVELKNL